jgi:hypothetical protein
MFEFKDGSGYLEHVTVCQFVSNLFRSLVSVRIGFISEENMAKDEEIQL